MASIPSNLFEQMRKVPPVVAGDQSQQGFVRMAGATPSDAFQIVGNFYARPLIYYAKSKNQYQSAGIALTRMIFDTDPSGCLLLTKEGAPVYKPDYQQSIKITPQEGWCLIERLQHLLTGHDEALAANESCEFAVKKANTVEKSG